MKKKNGNGKSKLELILYRLNEQNKFSERFSESVESRFVCMIEKLDKIKDTVGNHAVQIEGAVKQTASTQSELTEFKKDTKWFIGLGVAVSSAIASAISKFWK